MAEALIAVLLENLASAVFEHTKKAVTLVLNAEEDVQSLRSQLKAIQAVLEDAEKKQVTESRVGDWLQKLKDVVYEMDDVLDEWNTEILKQQVEEDENAVVTKKKVCFPMPSVCFCFGQANKVIHHGSIARRIKELNKKLSLIAAEKEMYDFHQSVGGHDEQQLIQRQKTTSLVDISKIYGREEEKEDLLRKLLRESSREGGKFLVIPIVGMGGMGKTTFAQLAYNNEKVRAHFDKRVWVCVSEPFDGIKIAKSIIESLGGSHSSSNELETLLLCIKSHVENKKIRLVLDDVWTEDQKEWENLKLTVILKSCAEGSTILVTTRKQGVAKMMRATSSMIHLDKLRDRDCLALFNSIAFLDREEDESSEFGVIGEKIVKKCKGLPLAVKTLGSLLWHKKTIREWWDVLNSKIWELEEVEQQVFQPLLLSYYDLAPAVKRCLLYCIIFPKDFELEKDKLIELWMSQDYLNSKENKEKRRIGEIYFESLALRSFFQDFKKDDLGHIEGCKMHDIVHDFVQFLSKKEFMIIEAVEGASQRMEVLDDKVRHLTLTSVPRGPLSFPASFSNCKNLRSLTVLNSKVTAISSDSILQMKSLRTLNMSNNSHQNPIMLNELPQEIGKLIHLRYLDLSRNSYLKEIPEAVCDLYNLQTLDVKFCDRVEKLPKAMGKLINLKHLYVYGNRFRYLPKGIRNLKSLQALDRFYWCEGEDDEALKLGDLGKMDQLQGSLWIEGWLGKNAKDDVSEIERAQFGMKEHLSELIVYFKYEDGEQRQGDTEIVKAMQPHQNLESLMIKYCHGSTESLYWIYSLSNLRQLVLCNWGFWEVLPPLGKLTSLEILRIDGMKKVKKVGVEFLGREAGILFPKLKQLSFQSMDNWEEWDSSETTIMPRLSSLRIWFCPKLKELPDFLDKIATLEGLQIVNCPILEREYKKGVGKEWHNVSHIPHMW